MFVGECMYSVFLFFSFLSFLVIYYPTRRAFLPGYNAVLTLRKQNHNTTQQNSYTEAITVLYRHLTFQMDLITLLALSISIPNHHLRAITKLEISGPPLNYIDSCYHLQYLPSFRHIHRPSSTNSSSSSSSSSSPSSNSPSPSHSPSHSPSPTTPQPTLYKINRKLTSFTRYRAGDIPIYTPRAPTAWDEACTRLLPRLPALRELRVSLKRPRTTPPLGPRCMSRAAERFLLRPLADGWDGCGQLLRLRLRVFEVRVDWAEGLEGHGWAEKGAWPVVRGRRLSSSPGEGEGEDEEEGEEGEEAEAEVEMVDMWRPSAFLLERGSRAELLAREGWEPWTDERWESYLVETKAGAGEGEDGVVAGAGADGTGRLWQDAPFTVIRSWDEGDEGG